MFHWICPECGQEIAPGVKECPVCEPQASTAPAPDAAVLAAEGEPPKLVVKPPIQEPQTVLQPTVILRPEVVLKPQQFPEQKPPAVLEAIPAQTRAVAMPQVPLGKSPVELPDPLLAPYPETFADRLADLAELLHAEHLPYTAPRIFQESAAPRARVESAGKPPVIIDVISDQPPERTLLAAPPSRLLLAEPQPPSVAADIPIETFHPHVSGYAGPVQGRTGPEACSPSAIRLPDASNRAVAPALARMQSYHAAADRLMGPSEYRTPVASAVAEVGLKMTLPGPALPRELMSLQAAGLVPIRSGRRGPGPASRFGWLTYIVAGMLLTAGVATYQLIPGTPARVVPAKVASPEPAPEPAPRPTNSLARLVEVTGIRFMEVNKRPQIHYLVVNHSGAPLTSMTVYVTLRATNAKPGQPPIARLNFRSPALAAFEAKEMFSSIERAVAPVELPDWQDLHADVEVQ